MKACKVEGCNNPIWSKGVCKMHSPRTPLNRHSVSSGKKEIVIYTSADGEKKLNEAVKKGFIQNNRNSFFSFIWNKRPHICQHCGKFLGREPRSYMFDHILEKQKYRWLEFEEENIWLVCLACHDEKTRGFLSEKYQEKINFVITKFNVS